MDSREVEFLVVGSGAGGATLARELAGKQREVLVLERGSYETQLGTLRDSFRYMDNNKVTKLPTTSNEDTILWRALMAGGSTVVSLANMTPCLQAELAEYGITLGRELAKAEEEIDRVMGSPPYTGDAGQSSRPEQMDRVHIIDRI